MTKKKSPAIKERVIKKSLSALSIIIITVAIFILISAMYQTISIFFLFDKAKSHEDHITGTKDIFKKIEQDFARLQPVQESTDQDSYQMATDTQKSSIDSFQISLELLGTVTGKGMEPFAIIKNLNTNQQDYYRLGDQIEGATLDDIQRRKVILVYNGEEIHINIGTKYQASPQENTQDLFSHNADESLNAQSEGTQHTINIDDGIRLKRGSLEIANKQHVLVKKNEIKSYLDNPEIIRNQAKIQEFNPGRYFEGVKITDIQKESFFDLVGIRENDIIIGVNNREIKSIEDAAQFIIKMSQNSKVSLQIKRNGERKSLEYDLW